MSAAKSNTIRRLVRIPVADALDVVRILDNELRYGLLDDDAEWEMTQLLSRIRAAINNPNKWLRIKR